MTESSLGERSPGALAVAPGISRTSKERSGSHPFERSYVLHTRRSEGVDDVLEHACDRLTEHSCGSQGYGRDERDDEAQHHRVLDHRLALLTLPGNVHAHSTHRLQSF